MRVAHYHGPEDLRVESVDEPTLSETAVRIDVAACGICGTDLHEYESGPDLTPNEGEPHPLFESTEGEPNPEPTQSGLFHLCVIDEDVEGLAARIDKAGGDHYSEVWQIFEDDDQYTLTYCRDPYGNLVEIYSHSHERIYSNRPG